MMEEPFVPRSVSHLYLLPGFASPTALWGRTVGIYSGAVSLSPGCVTPTGDELEQGQAVSTGKAAGALVGCQIIL